MTQHEKALAIQSIISQKCNIDSAEQKSVLLSLQNNVPLDLDPVDAAIEAAVATQAGVEVTGASSGSSFMAQTVVGLIFGVLTDGLFVLQCFSLEVTCYGPLPACLVIGAIGVWSGVSV